MTTPDHTKDGLVSFEFDCAELNCVLTCWFEHEPAERGSAFEPAYPAVFTLMHAYLPGSSVDLASVLHDSIVEEINEWVDGEAEDVAREAQDDFEIDRYIDSKDY